MIPANIPIYCIAMGEGDHDRYVGRLYAMLKRHMPCPFTLCCYSDLPRNLPEGIDLRVRTDWETMLRPGMRRTTTKLRFFDPAFVPHREFLYVDTTLVIRQNMQSLLDFAFSSPADLVIVEDWNTADYNSCVMRIRSGPLQGIHDAFAGGKSYPQRVPGDQDFIFNYLREANLQNRAEVFPTGLIISYKATRKCFLTKPEAARQMVREATIIKFHGKPRPHQVLNPFYNLFKIRLRRFPRNLRAAGFAVDEIRRHWRD